MKAIQINKFGIDQLTLVDVAKPVPGAHEVLIKMEAASLNFLETALVKGLYGAIAFPFTPSSEGAGVVEAVGEAVTAWKPGDRVTTHYNQLWQSGKAAPHTQTRSTGNNTPGVLAEYYVMPDYALVRTPANLTSVESATLPVAAVTAWTGLMEYANIQPGQTVLTQGSGGVSLFALQIARAAGARVIATTGDAGKVERLKALGASEVINYKEHPEWYKEVKRLTNGEGVHATLDIAGTSTIDNSIKSVAHHGFVGLVGFMTGMSLPMDFMSLWQSLARIQAYSVGSKASLQQVANTFEYNGIKPVIDSVYDLSTVQEAFYHLESGKQFGKIVVEIK
ncbi:MAG: NAD(P)-dependent alcohol dehydrogenase [Chitinophaga sp.]|uniref:zinc-dependent alcohol dehydrogenase family protein n=1 Tax=Chitinophaga sp. TaxID=1869181 RepID=UPI0025BEC5D2|nr:NAD(P)-dependent alcohol dehydrogenase [Chitinophaga sp.]MBV8255121.1 NAD(P)-dependent alcohol dehydrogenase [Chitinophaga sp.]